MRQEISEEILKLMPHYIIGEIIVDLTSHLTPSQVKKKRRKKKS